MTRWCRGACRRRGQGTVRCPARQGQACFAAADGPADEAAEGRRRGPRETHPPVRWHQKTSQTAAAAPCRTGSHPGRPPSRHWGCRGRDRVVRRWLCRPGPCCPTGEATHAERRLPAPGAWRERDIPHSGGRGCCIVDDSSCDLVICRRLLDRRRRACLVFRGNGCMHERGACDMTACMPTTPLHAHVLR